jgi:hypothetical protein
MGVVFAFSSDSDGLTSDVVESRGTEAGLPLLTHWQPMPLAIDRLSI